MGKGDRIGIMLDMNPGIIEIFSDGNDIPGEGAIRHVAFTPKLRGKEIYGKLKKDIGQILRKLREQRCSNNRSRSMPRPYTYAGDYPTAHKYSTVYGISQGQKYIDDFRPTCEFKVQIRLKKFLVSRILCKYGRSYIRNQLEEDYAADQISIKNLPTRLRVTRESRIKDSRT